MDTTRRIEKLTREYIHKSTKELCEIYNDSYEECVFNNFDARTKVYSMMVAAEEVITLSRLNECWFDDRSCRYKMYEEE